MTSDDKFEQKVEIVIEKGQNEFEAKDIYGFKKVETLTDHKRALINLEKEMKDKEEISETLAKNKEKLRKLKQEWEQKKTGLLNMYLDHEVKKNAVLFESNSYWRSY